MKKIHKIDKKKGHRSRPPSFDGILITINSILQLHKDIKTEEFPYILTTRLNQDVIENFFAVLRQKGGYNKNPTVKEFRTSFKSCFINSIIKTPEKANCEPDDDSFLNLSSTEIQYQYQN